MGVDYELFEFESKRTKNIFQNTRENVKFYRRSDDNQSNESRHVRTLFDRHAVCDAQRVQLFHRLQRNKPG